MNQRRPKPTDLQSAPFDQTQAFSLMWWDLQGLNPGRADLQSAALPTELRSHGVRERIRTADLQGHNLTLYQLSYTRHMAPDGGVDPHSLSAAHGFQNRCGHRRASSGIWRSRADSNGRWRSCSPLPFLLATGSHGSGLRARTSSNRVKADHTDHYTSPENGACGGSRTLNPLPAPGLKPDVYASSTTQANMVTPVGLEPNASGLTLEVPKSLISLHFRVPWLRPASYPA